MDTEISKTATNKILEQKLQKTFPNWYRLFTDRSKTDQGVGYAVYDPQAGTHNMYKLQHYLSINTEEILALYFGFRYIQKNLHPPHPESYHLHRQLKRTA